jgi:hypothetical protein
MKASTTIHSRRGPFFVICVKQGHWGAIEGDYPTKSQAIHAKARIRKCNPDLAYAIYEQPQERQEAA